MMRGALSSGIHSSRLHVVLYSMLLVATPFVLLQNFLVEEISRLSTSTVQFAGADLPLLPIMAIALAVGLTIAYRSHLTKLRLLAVLVTLFMIATAQQVTDYYFQHNFYDLQQNWHYIAYGIFAYMMYRDLAPRGTPMAKIMLTTYLSALAFSSFDEAFQMHMSSRVFDVGDIAKDLWGTLTGISFVYLAVSEPGELARQWRRIRHVKLRAYFTHPPSLMVLMLTFAGMFLVYGSLLTDFEYCPHVAILTIGSFVIFFGVLHLTQSTLFLNILVVIIICASLLQGYLLYSYRTDHVVHNEFGVTVYKGLPVVFFDMLIFPDGGFRLVDKKHYFNARDLEFLKRQATDIIIIGSGAEGRGGQGLPRKAPVQFIYNPHTLRGTQVITLETARACEVFNRLRKEGKNVLFVLHNTC